MHLPLQWHGHCHFLPDANARRSLLLSPIFCDWWAELMREHFFFHKTICPHDLLDWYRSLFGLLYSFWTDRRHKRQVWTALNFAVDQTATFFWIYGKEERLWNNTASRVKSRMIWLHVNKTGSRWVRLIQLQYFRGYWHGTHVRKDARC